MASQQRVCGSFVRGVFVQTLAPVLAFVALANLGCAASIAATYPHLDRRSVCVRVPGIEADASEFIFADGNVPISNLHPGVVDRVAPTARTVFEYDPNADPSSTRYLPAPYNELTCPAQFSILPSNEPQTSPLPEASLDLLVREARPEVVPRTVAEKLASCSRQSSGHLEPIEHTVRINVYVTKEGQAVSALIEQSTVGDRETEACLVAALRMTSWPVDATVVNATSVQTGASNVSPASKLFLAQPAPAVPVPDSGPESGVRLRLPAVEPPTEPGGGFKMPPRIFVIPLNPLVAAAAVFGIIYFWSETDTPAWADELNPITRQPYTSRQEYDEVRRLSPEEIKRQREQIANSQSQPPPAPAPAHAPAPQPQPAQPEIAATSLRPAGASPCPPCPTPPPNASRRDTGHKHWPCKGDHTHFYRYEYNQNPKTCQCFLKEIETHVECH